MADIIAFPSELFPAYPALAIELPEGWSPIAVPETVLAGGAPVEADAFRANVCVSVQRTPGARTLEEAVAAVLGRLDGAPGYAELARRNEPVLDLPGFALEASFDSAEAGALVQSLRIAVVPHAYFSDTVVAVATVDGASAEALLPQLRAALGSLALQQG